MLEHFIIINLQAKGYFSSYLDLTKFISFVLNLAACKKSIGPKTSHHTLIFDVEKSNHIGYLLFGQFVLGLSNFNHSPSMLY